MKAEGGEKGAETRLVSFSLRGHPPREEPGRASIWAEDWTFSVTGKLMPSLDSEGTSSNNSIIPINACETSAFQKPGSGRSLPLDSRSPPRAQGQPSVPVTSKRQPSTYLKIPHPLVCYTSRTINTLSLKFPVSSKGKPGPGQNQSLAFHLGFPPKQGTRDNASWWLACEVVRPIPEGSVPE